VKAINLINLELDNINTDLKNQRDNITPLNTANQKYFQEDIYPERENIKSLLQVIECSKELDDLSRFISQKNY